MISNPFLRYKYATHSSPASPGFKPTRFGGSTRKILLFNFILNPGPILPAMIAPRVTANKNRPNEVNRQHEERGKMRGNPRDELVTRPIPDEQRESCGQEKME